jgi:hypothetical protein
VRVDVADLLVRDAAHLHGLLHGGADAAPVFGHVGDVVRVARHPVGDHLAVDLRPALQGVPQLFQNQDARALADHKAVAPFVEGT